MSLTQSEFGSARPWPAHRPERWPIERLIPYANNARIHTEADLAKMAASIAKWGWTMSVLADEDGVLIAGHLRISAAAKLGLNSVPVIFRQGSTRRDQSVSPLSRGRCFDNPALRV
jgi:ParB-like chromosome segregation protein Spo0J